MAATAVLDPPEEPSTPPTFPNPKPTHRFRKYIPFTQAWRERKSSHKQSSASTPQMLSATAPSSPPSQPLSSSSPKPKPTKQTTVVADPGPGERGKNSKSLAQYGHHDGKGAVGWKSPARSPDMPYPKNTWVDGKRVVAQHGHVDDRWAVENSDILRGTWKP